MARRTKIVVVGGGPAGISVISGLRHWSFRDEVQITLLEPSDFHYYQSAWINSAFALKKEIPSRRHIGELFSPDDINWVNEAAGEFSPENNYVLTETGLKVNYDYLVVACGLQTDWEKIKGLHGKLGRDGITSAASFSTLNWTKSLFSKPNGKVIFTESGTLCNMHSAGKELVMRLQAKLGTNIKEPNKGITYYSGSNALYPVDACQSVLKERFKKNSINWELSKELVEVKPKAKIAVFRNLIDNTYFERDYDLLHIVPPMRSPFAVARSALADEVGLIDVDQHTLQHKKYSNIFAIGDIANTPVVKCISAIKMQLPVVVSNIVAGIVGTQPLKKYDGTNNQVIMVSEHEAILFRCKFMRHVNLPFSYGLSGSQAIGRLNNLLSPISYWRYLLSAKSSRIPFPDS